MTFERPCPQESTVEAPPDAPSPLAEASRAALVGFLAAAIVMTACSGDDPVGPRAANVEISSPDLAFTSIGESATLRAVVTNANGAEIVAPVQWSSTEPTVVRISASGTVTALANGEAVLIAEADGIADSLGASVVQELVELSIAGPDTLFNPGVPTRLSAVATDALGSGYVRTPIEWEVDDPGVASLEPGLLTPTSGGEVTVTVRAESLEATKVVTTLPEIELEVPAELATTLQWAMEDTAANNGVVGSSALVFIPGVGTWQGVTGQSDNTSVLRPDMMFYPGSIKKMITSAAVLALVDDGTLTLDDPIGTWVEPFENTNVSMAVTIRQLLGNTSGLHSFTSHPGFFDSLLVDPGRVWEPRGTLERFVLAPEFPPDSTWKSSNTGYVLAGIAAEEASGRPFPALLRERLFDVMGMDEVWIAAFEEPTSPVAATWHRVNGGPLTSSALLETTSAHTLFWPQTVLSARSLLTFGTELFGDFLSPALREEMMTTVPDDEPFTNQVAGGLGVRMYDFLGRTQWGHSGSQGTGSGFFVWDEESGIAISILYNQNGVSHFNSHFRLIPGLLSIALEAQGGA